MKGPGYTPTPKPDTDPISKSKMSITDRNTGFTESITVAKNGNADRRSRKYNKIARNCGCSKY